MAASITHGGTLPDSAGKSDFYGLIDSATISGIVGTELAKIDTAGKLSGKAFTELANIPAGAGEIPAANLPASTSSADDTICRGFELLYNNTLTVIVQAGVLNHGSTKITKTSNTTLTLATAADWWDGATDTYAGGAGWCYIGVNSSGDIKLCGANAPDCADSSGNTDGTKLYWNDSAAYWRIIGAVRVHTDDTIIMPWYQQGNKICYDDTENAIMVPTIADTTPTTFSDITCSAQVPAISILVDAELTATATSASLQIRKNGSSATTGTRYDWGANGYLVAEHIPTDSGRVFEVKMASNTLGCYVKGYTLNIR